MRQNNINKITCTKIALIKQNVSKQHLKNSVNKITCVKITCTNDIDKISFLKTIYQMIYFKIYQTLTDK